jgi:hypothetical protein
MQDGNSLVRHPILASIKLTCTVLVRAVVVDIALKVLLLALTVTDESLPHVRFARHAGNVSFASSILHLMS